MTLNTSPELRGHGAQIIRAETQQGRFNLFDPIDHRLNLFDVIGRLVPNKGLEKLCKHDTKVQRQTPPS